MFFTLIYRKKGKEKIIGKSTNTTTTQLLYSLKNDQIVESTHLWCKNYDVKNTEQYKLAGLLSWIAFHCTGVPNKLETCSSIDKNI